MSPSTGQEPLDVPPAQTQPPALTRTFHVAPFSLEALLRLASLFLPLGLSSKSFRKSGVSTGLCRRGDGKQGQSPGLGRPTPGTDGGYLTRTWEGLASQQGILFPSLRLKIMFPSLIWQPRLEEVFTLRSVATPTPTGKAQQGKGEEQAGDVSLQAHISTRVYIRSRPACLPAWPALAPCEGHFRPHCPTRVHGAEARRADGGREERRALGLPEGAGPRLAGLRLVDLRGAVRPSQVVDSPGASRPCGFLPQGRKRPIAWRRFQTPASLPGARPGL